MIKSMVVGFCFIGGLCYSVIGVEFDNTCAVSGKWNLSRIIPRLYGLVYKTLRLCPLVVEHSLVVMSVGLNPMGSQFAILALWNLCLESVGHKIWDPVEDSDTGRPSSINVWTKYVFAFQYWSCKVCVENRWVGGRKHCFINFCFLVVL